MKYEYEIEGNMEWIESVTEMVNHDDCLIITIDFKPKRLEFCSISCSDGRVGISAINTDETLYCSSPIGSEVYVLFNGLSDLNHSIISHGKYECTICFYSCENTRLLFNNR